MTMPPSGVAGLMDEESRIEAEIQLELENINLDDEVEYADDIDNEQQEVENEAEIQVPEELDEYIRRIQDQTNKFEQELQECDELLQHSNKNIGGGSTALIPYEDQSLLTQLAQEHGVDPEEYKKKILEDLENDDDIIDEDLADLIGGDEAKEEQCSSTGEPGSDGTLVVQIEKAVEEGVTDPEDLPVSQDLVPVNGKTPAHADIQNILRGQLEKLEKKYQDRMDTIKKDEAFRRDEEEVREKRVAEERQWKLQEIQREEQQLEVHRQMVEKEAQREQVKAEQEMQENMKKFEEEMAVLQRETERQKEEHKVAMEMERHRQTDRQLKAATDIQRTYRGYRVRKDVTPVLHTRCEERRKEREEERIKQVEGEIERRKEEQKNRDDQERKRLEDEAKHVEELKRQKEEEKQRLEEEKKRKKEEEERLKQEEKKRKEEEKQRKKEEEKRRKEEEKLRKEEEKRRKEEEKRRKEEEERVRKEEEKRKKEEEKLKKEEEKRQREEEKKREKDRIEEEKNKGRMESENKDNVKELLEDEQKETNTSNTDKKNSDFKENVGKSENVDNHTVNDKGTVEVKTEIIDNKEENSQVENNANKCKEDQNTVKRDTENNSNQEFSKIPSRPKTPRSSRTPRTPRVATPKTDSSKSVNMSKDVSKDTGSVVDADCLPEPLEVLRLKFMRECQPWSKVSNEPWKLKGGMSRKPARRPSSAKKLPPIPDNVILQAARVASLKLVTTVELHDLPGNNTSTLGQCWGLKYLTLTNCNLVALDGLSQCKQLQYINVQNNRLEYIDVKDLGNIQYLNLAHNRLSTIHGLDNCTNVRWLDMSYNNVTRLGGLDTLRRLHTLNISHNQLISCQGLGATPTLQMIDMSHNHLQHVEDIEKLCLLLSLDVSSNNLQHVPDLCNQVILLELLIPDNSLSLINSLAATWLPLLGVLNIQQNSIDSLPSLQNCLLLRNFNMGENQLLDAEMIETCVKHCYYLEELDVEENPVITDLTHSFYSKLTSTCPRLISPVSDSPGKTVPVKPRTSFEAMCLTQSQSLRDVILQFHNSVRSQTTGTSSLDVSQMCDLHFKFCDRTFNMAVEHRYAHEYGEVSITMPTAPSAPKSGRPLSSRQREKFMNPKEMFENALKGSNNDSISCNNSNNVTLENTNLPSSSSNPKDLFENALKSASGKTATNSDNFKPNTMEDSRLRKQTDSHGTSGKDLFEQALSQANTGRNGHSLVNGHSSNGADRRSTAAIVIQAWWRGWRVRHEIAEHTRYWLSATTIQAAWRGYWTRKQLQQMFSNPFIGLEPELLQRLNKSAVKIQACWKGFILRKKLLAALEFAQCTFSDDEDEDAMNFGDEFDLDKFVDIDQDLLDMDWKPPETPDIPNNFPVLKKPPSGKLPNNRVPPIPLTDLRPPSNPRRAWRNAESPMSDTGKIPRPPSSVASTELTMRSGVSKKEEKLTEEWGFKDTGTAQLMMQRAKKMKYNAERRKKISKLDPKQRLALFRKLEEVTHPPTHTVPQRKTLPRKEYFQARQDEIVKQEQEKRHEFHTRASRTFEWLHSQVGDLPVSDSVINKGFREGPKYMPPEHNLPELFGGKRVQLVSSPMSMELQSLDSASALGQPPKPRRFSAGSGSSSSKLPPIQPTSAPMSHVKERMSFRNPVVNQSVGWGGGKKRTK